MITPNAQFGTVPSPLMYQYMTQGQLGYMPQAQYLTPSEYGAFRATPEQQGLDPAIQQHSLWQNYLIANQGRIPWMPGMTAPFSIDTYNPGVRQMEELIRARRRVDDTFGAFHSSLVGGALPMAMSMIPGMGVVGRTAMGLGSSVLSTLGVDSYENQLRRSRMLQSRTYNAVTVGGDTAVNRRGFSLSAASELERSIRHMSADTYEFNRDDLDRMFDAGMKNDLFAFSASADDYKKTLKLIKENITDLADAMGTADFGELAEQMKRLQKFGAGLEKAVATTRRETMFSRISGMSHDRMIQMYGSAGAAAYTSRGLTGYQGSMAAMAGAAALTIGERLGTFTAGDISRMGGVTGGAQSMTEAGAGIMDQEGDALLAMAMTPNGELDLEGVSNILNMDYRDMRQLAAHKYRNLTMGQKALFRIHRGEMMEELGDRLGEYGPTLIIGKLAQAIGSGHGFSGIDGLRIGLVVLKESGTINDAVARQVEAMYSDPDLRKELHLQAQQEIENQVKNLEIKTKREHSPEAGLSRWWENTTAGLFDWMYGGSARSRAVQRDFNEGVAAGKIRIPEMGLTGLEEISSTLDFSGKGLGEALLAGDSDGVRRALSLSGDGKYLSRGTLNERWKSRLDSEITTQYRLLELAHTTQALSDEEQAELEEYIRRRFGLSDEDMVFLRERIHAVVNTAGDITPGGVRELLREVLRRAGMDGSRLGDTLGGMSSNTRVQRYIAGTRKRGSTGFASDVARAQREALSRQAQARKELLRSIHADGGSGATDAVLDAFKELRDTSSLDMLGGPGGTIRKDPERHRQALRDLQMLVQAKSLPDDLLAPGKEALAGYGMRGVDIAAVANSLDLSVGGYRRADLVRELTGALKKHTGSTAEARKTALRILDDPRARQALFADIGQRRGTARDEVILKMSDVYLSAGETRARSLVGEGTRLQDRVWEFASGGKIDAQARGAFSKAIRKSPMALTASSLEAALAAYAAAGGEDTTGVYRRAIRDLGSQLGLSPEEIDAVIDGGSLSTVRDSVHLGDDEFQAALRVGRLKGRDGLREDTVRNLPGGSRDVLYNVADFQLRKANNQATMVMARHGVTSGQLLNKESLTRLLKDKALMADPKMAALLTSAKENAASGSPGGYADIVLDAALGDMGSTPSYSTTDTTQRLSTVQGPEYTKLVEAMRINAKVIGSMELLPETLSELNTTLSTLNSTMRRQGFATQAGRK